MAWYKDRGRHRLSAMGIKSVLDNKSLHFHDVPHDIVEGAKRMYEDVKVLFPPGWEQRLFCVEITQYTRDVVGGEIAYGYYYNDEGLKQVHVWNVVDGWEFDINVGQHPSTMHMKYWVGKKHPFAKKLGIINTLREVDDEDSDYIDVWELIE